MNEGVGQSRLGLTRGEVALTESDPSWSKAFERLATQMREALGSAALGIEHVGSTAVPGLRAKPILDIALGVFPQLDVDELVARVSPLGYEFRGDKGGDIGLLFVLEDSPMHRIAHVHTVTHEGQQWKRYIALRNYLRTSAGERAEYEALKESLAERFPRDRQAYTAGKEIFITQLIDSIGLSNDN